MRRPLMILTLAGVLGVLLSASDASACCHKKKCPQPATCVVVEPCPPPPPPPCPPPAPVCEPAPKKCGLFHHQGGCGHKKMGLKLGGLCHKKQPCPPAPCPVVYEAPVYAAPQGSPQAYASGQ